MTGKTVLITGGTGGIGRAAAIGLASMGARVGITGRDRARAERAAAAIARESGNPAVDVFVADMSSQTEVRRLAGEVLSAYPRLDVLLNNVGGFWAHRHVTADGLEHTFALNHLAPFLLTNLLLERLMASAPARVVTVSSGAQAMGRIDFDDLMGERTYSGQRAYNQSKLANVMFTYELARRLEGTGVTATVLHPGMTSTAFGAEDSARAMAPIIAVLRPFMRSPEKGADTAVYLASSPEAEGVTGRYFANRKARKSHKSSYDTATTARLWRVSADLVGLPDTAARRRPGSRKYPPPRTVTNRGQPADLALADGVEGRRVRGPCPPAPLPDQWVGVVVEAGELGLLTQVCCTNSNWRVMLAQRPMKWMTALVVGASATPLRSPARAVRPTAAQQPVALVQLDTSESGAGLGASESRGLVRRTCAPIWHLSPSRVRMA